MPAPYRYTPPALGKCRRCFHPKPATTQVDVGFGGAEYRLSLCEDHADRFQSDLFGWTRVADVIYETRSREAAIALRERVPVPAAVEVAEPEPEPELAPWHEALPHGVREALSDVPGIRDWRLSRTARARAAEADIEVSTVLLAAVMPERTRPSDQDPTVSLHTRGNVTAVVCPSNSTILSVSRRSTREEPFRGYKAS